jgi:ankyrin repeat protein
MYKLFLICLLFQLHVSAQDVFDIARNGSGKEMQKHLKKHPEHLELQSESGFTPLLLATYRGRYEVAVALLDAGADPSKCFKEGSPIYGVIFKADARMLQLLIERGVNVNDTCQFETLGYPLHLAINLLRYEQIEQLLTAGARLDILDPQGRTISQLMLFFNDEKLNQLIQTYEK